VLLAERGEENGAKARGKGEASDEGRRLSQSGVGGRSAVAG